VNNYIKKLLIKLSNPSWYLRYRGELIDVYALSEDEYLNGIVNFEVSELKKLEGVVFDSNNHPYSGSYDFTFKVNNIDFIQYTKSSVSLDHSLFGEMIRIDVEIQEGGTLGNKPLFITKELIYDGDDGWEIENEIRDIIIEMIMTKESDLFNNIRTYDIVELYINYPEE
jgi:hypothetical protein